MNKKKSKNKVSKFNSKNNNKIMIIKMMKNKI